MRSTAAAFLLALFVGIGCANADSLAPDEAAVNEGSADDDSAVLAADEELAAGEEQERPKKKAKSKRKRAKRRPAAADGPIPEGAGVDEVLDALDARGQELREFSANVRLTESDDIGLSSTRAGRVLYQTREQDPRIRVTFDTREDESTIFEEKKDYLLEGEWLVERDFDRRIEVRREVLAPGQKLNLLKLGEGPFPLPIGQKREDVLEQFEVELIEPADGDPEGTVHIRLVPKPEGQFAEELSVMDVWVDRQSRMPVRIETTDAQNVTYRQTELQDVLINPDPPLEDSAFELDEVDVEGEGWDLHVEPYEG